MEWIIVFNLRLLKLVFFVVCCIYFLWINGKDLWMMVKYGRWGFIYYFVFWIFFINFWLLLVCDWFFSRVIVFWFWNRDNNRIWNLYFEVIIKVLFFRLYILFICFVNVVGGKCWLEEYDWRCWKEKYDLYGG